MARASKSQQVTYLAALIAISWVLGISLYLVEQRYSVAFPYLRPVIDGVVVALLIRRMSQPGYVGGALYGIIITILLIQASFRLTVTAVAYYFPEVTINLPWWMMWVINRLFELQLLMILVVSGLRWLRDNRRHFYDRMVHRIPLPERQEAQFVQGNRSIIDAALSYYMKKAFPEVQRIKDQRAEKRLREAENRQ